MIRSNHYL